MLSLNKTRYFRLRQPLIRLLYEILRLKRDLCEFLFELEERIERAERIFEVRIERAERIYEVQIERAKRIHEVRVAVCRYAVKTLDRRRMKALNHMSLPK